MIPRQLVDASRVVEAMCQRWAAMSLDALSTEIKLMHEQGIADAIVDLACKIRDEKH